MKIFEIALILIILVSAILIGSPISYNCTILTVVIILIGIIFCIYNFLKKEKIMSSKLDWYILLLCLTPIIPLAFKTYISLNDTITSLLKYIACFFAYILTKKIVQTNEKGKSTIVNTVIISTMILSIIGIDQMTTNYFGDILEKLNLPYVINFEKRMFSSLGYANSFAIIMAVSILLNLGKINNRKGKKYELLYAGALFLGLACLILTYSRTVILLLAIAIIAYILINREKKKTIYTIYLLGIQIILTLIYVMIWNKFYVWLVTIPMFVISCLVLKLIDVLYNKIEKISKKAYIILIVISLIIMILGIYIGMKLTKPLVIFEANTSSEEVKYKVQNIESNKEYVLQFGINAKSALNNIENYIIVIEEEDKYYDTVASHEISFNNFDGIKEIDFTTTDKTIELAIYFRSKIRIAQQGLTVNLFTINEEEHPLNYLYLPVSLVDRLKDINIKDKSVWERGTYYLDSFKIIKNHVFTGQGANAWKYKYMEVRSFDYSTTEVHSFVLQLILEYGVIALIIFIIIVIILFINFIKCVKINKNLAIFLALFVLLGHSIIDFDMSFFYLMLIFFVLIGLVVMGKKRKDSKLQVLISTMNEENDEQINCLLSKMNIKSDYLVINQTKKDVTIENQKVITVKDIGLSKSRNLALENATNDIILFADNDVTYVDNYEEIIRNTYEKYPDADCICFWVESKNKDRIVKKLHNGRIGILKIMKICSFQISIKREKAQEFRFDENFGAGTKYDRGEETIFLKDFLKKGYSIRFDNTKIAEVKQEESTWFKGLNEEYFFKQGKIFKRIYPIIYPLIEIQFLIRKHKLYKDNIKIIDAFRQMLKTSKI